MKNIKIELLIEGKIKVGNYDVEETLTPVNVASLLDLLTEQFWDSVEIKWITIK